MSLIPIPTVTSCGDLSTPRCNCPRNRSSVVAPLTHRFANSDPCRTSDSRLKRRATYPPFAAPTPAPVESPSATYTIGPGFILLFPSEIPSCPHPNETMQIKHANKLLISIRIPNSPPSVFCLDFILTVGLTDPHAEQPKNEETKSRLAPFSVTCRVSPFNGQAVGFQRTRKAGARRVEGEK